MVKFPQLIVGIKGQQADDEWWMVLTLDHMSHTALAAALSSEVDRPCPIGGLNLGRHVCAKKQGLMSWLPRTRQARAHNFLDPSHPTNVFPLSRLPPPPHLLHPLHNLNSLTTTALQPNHHGGHPQPHPPRQAEA